MISALAKHLIGKIFFSPLSFKDSLKWDCNATLVRFWPALPLPSLSFDKLSLGFSSFFSLSYRISCIAMCVNRERRDGVTMMDDTDVGATLELTYALSSY